MGISRVVSRHALIDSALSAAHRYNAKRCRTHGGLSTGPKTLERKRKAAKGIGCVYDEKTDRYIKIDKRGAWADWLDL